MSASQLFLQAARQEAEDSTFKPLTSPFHSMPLIHFIASKVYFGVQKEKFEITDSLADSLA